MALKKKSILLIMAFLIGCDLCACGKEDSVVGESLVEDTEKVSSTEETKSVEEEAAEQWEKGYDLPVDEQVMLSRLVDTFFSRTSWTMLLYAGNHSISVA